MYYAVVSYIESNNCALNPTIELITQNEQLARFFIITQKVGHFNDEMWKYMKHEYIPIDTNDIGEVRRYLKEKNFSTNYDFDRIVEPIFKLVLLYKHGQVAWYMEVNDGFYFDKSNVLFGEYVTSHNYLDIVNKVEEKIQSVRHEEDIPREVYLHLLND